MNTESSPGAYTISFLMKQVLTIKQKQILRQLSAKIILKENKFEMS